MILASIIKTIALAVALTRHPTNLQPERAIAHAVAAELAATDRLPAELLLGVARVESNYRRGATSHVWNHRRVGVVAENDEPIGKGPWFCGPLQTIAGLDWDLCLEQRGLITGYATGADELRTWLRAARGDLRAALRGHACGYWGLDNPCKSYDARVLRAARRLWRLL